MIKIIIILFVLLCIYIDCNYNKKSNIEYFKNENRDDIIESIISTKNKYITEQPNCIKNIRNKNKNYYNNFLTAYSNYLRLGFKKELGYIPDKTSEDEMLIKELTVYLALLQKLPKCNILIPKYSKNCADKLLVNTEEEAENKISVKKNTSKQHKNSVKKDTSKQHNWETKWVFLKPEHWNTVKKKNCYNKIPKNNLKDAFKMTNVGSILPKFNYIEENK